MSWDLCHSPGRPHQQLFRLRLQNFFSRLLLRLLLFWAFFSIFLMLLCQTREKGGLLEVISSCSSPSHNLQTEHEDHKGGDKPLFSSTRMHRSDDDLLSFFLPPVSFLDLSGALRLKAALRASSEQTQTAKIQSSHGRRVKAPPLICAFINGTVAQGGDKNRSQSAAFCRLTVHPLRITTLDVT